MQFVTRRSVPPGFVWDRLAHMQRRCLWTIRHGYWEHRCVFCNGHREAINQEPSLNAVCARGGNARPSLGKGAPLLFSCLSRSMGVLLQLPDHRCYNFMIVRKTTQQGIPWKNLDGTGHPFQSYVFTHAADWAALLLTSRRRGWPGCTQLRRSFLSNVPCYFKPVP